MKYIKIIVIYLMISGCESSQPSTTETQHKKQLVSDGHRPPQTEDPQTIKLPQAVIANAGIKVASVKRHKIEPRIRLPGEIVANLANQAHVAARVEGTIEHVNVRPGDVVAKGDVLATIRAPNLQSLRSAAAALRARATSARAAADRLTALVATRMATKQEAEAARLEANALQAEAKAASDRLQALGLKPKHRRAVFFDAKSPINGIVMSLDKIVGDPVTAEAIIASLVSTENVWFVGHVFERDVARIAAGQAATVHLNAYPKETFQGEIEYVSHQVDAGSHTLSARIPLKNSNDRLRIGLFGTAHVVGNDAHLTPVLAVPNSAISRLKDGHVVFIHPTDNAFKARKVEIGLSDARFTEIVSGLKLGERIVIDGAFTVKSAMLRSTFAEDEG